MSHLLVVDDEQAICWGLAKLAAKLKHTATTASSAEQALDLSAEEKPDAIVLDIRLPGIDGLTAMPRFRARFGDVPIIVITAFGDLDNAVNAIRNGAFEYLTKPFDLKAAEHAIRRALASRQLRPRSEVPARDATQPTDLVGRSPQMQEVFKNIALVAPSEACVHLHGESGTGKELVARAIHRYSRRSDAPFVPVHVASLSASLAESELFGHERGAFTGADESRLGLLRQADGGTVFLDEIADIAPSIQVKLLRALEYGEILPVGGSQPIKTNFRLISATHGHLEQLVQTGAFRHDLYFRLVTYRIDLPPLRDRDGDIELLADHFLTALSAGTASGGFSTGLLAELKRRPWYGNVREFRNAIEHALIKARGQAIAIEHLPPPAAPPASSLRTPGNSLSALIRQWAEHELRGETDDDDLYERFLNLVEPPLLEAALDRYHSQVATAARRLGIHRTTLRKKLDQHGLRGADQEE
jgi:two-component system nitrogen regulation response regulator GlnG